MHEGQVRRRFAISSSVSVVLSAALLGSGCMLQDVRDQVELLDHACLIEGVVTGAGLEGQTVVVVLTPGDAEVGLVPEPVDYTLPDDSGAFSFALQPGRYQLLAFQDGNHDLELDADEPALHVNPDEGLECGAAQRLRVEDIVIGQEDRVAGGVLSIGASRNLVAGAMASAVSLGQLTAFGEVVDLADARFDLELARDSLWRPVDFLRAGHAGVYFAEPLDDRRTPVLFIHGINGSPRVLEPLIRHLQGDRYQAMYFYYPSGLRIGQVAWHLDRIMRELEHRHRIDRYHVVAHSMGGLVAKAWLRERAHQRGRARILSFVSLSTPWSGYPSARQGVDHSPVVVPVWRDMATGSEFLQDLFDAPGPVGSLPQHHLLFSFQQSGWLPNGSGDGVAALSSMLPAHVQRQAASVFGVDTGHVEILSDETAQARVETVLRRAE